MRLEPIVVIRVLLCGEVTILKNVSGFAPIEDWLSHSLATIERIETFRQLFRSQTRKGDHRHGLVKLS